MPKPSLPKELSGIYRHYRGSLYEVVGVARHSETLEDLVIYKPVAKDYMVGEVSFWARPFTMFCEQIVHEDKLVPRFEKIANALSEIELS